MFQNDHSRAQTLFEEAVPRLREVQDYPFLGMVLRRLGQLAMYQSDLTKAHALIDESLGLQWNIRDYRGVGACLAVLATMSAAQGQTERATKLFGAVDAFLESIRTPLLPYDKQQFERNVKQLHDQADEAAFAAAWAEGHALTVEQAVDYALEQTASS